MKGNNWQKLMNIYICVTFNLIQVNYRPTRNNNTMDIIFENDMATLVTDIDVSKASISSHNVTEITSNCCIEKDEDRYNTAMEDTSGVTNMNLHFDTIMWKEINDRTAVRNWNEVFRDNCMNIIRTLFYGRIKLIVQRISITWKEGECKTIDIKREKTVDEQKRTEKEERFAISREIVEELDEKIRNFNKEIIETHRRKQTKWRESNIKLGAESKNRKRIWDRAI